MPLARHPPVSSAGIGPRSEVKLDRGLDYAVALLLSDGAEQRCVDLAGGRIETESQIASVERPQRVIQEVVAVEPNLQLLRFFDLEVLEQTQIHVEEARPIDRGQDGRTVLADGGGHGEATRV